MNSNIASKVLCAGLRTSCLGTSLTDEDVTHEVVTKHNALPGAMRVTKTRLREAIEPFKKLRSEARRYFNGATLPGISDDLRILPSARLKAMQDKVADFRKRDRDLLDKLVANYAAEIDKDRAALGDRFDQSLYPAAEALGQHFDINLTVCDLPTGDYNRIAGLDEQAREQMRKEHDALLATVSANARNEVLTRMTKLIQHVADKLSDPNAKVFHESTFTNLQEYLDMVPDLNVTGDPVLDQLRREAREKLNLSMKAVKDNEVLKAKVAADAKDILSRFGTLGARKLVA